MWSYCGNPPHLGRQGATIYVVTAETSQCGQARPIDVHSDCGNLKNVCACVL